MSTYNYSIQNDTLNAKVGDSLEQSIKESSIIIALSSITVNGDSLSISFKANLGATEETELNTIVANHDGSDISEEIITKFQYTLPQGGQRVTDRGFQFVAAAGVVTTYDFSVTEDLFVKEGFAIAFGFDPGDNVSMSIVHPLTMQPLHYYLKNLPLQPHRGDSTVGYVDAKNEAITETNFNGLIIRMEYDSKGVNDVNVGVTMRTYS